MAGILSDEIDFRAFERSTDAAVKIRKASAFESELQAEFADRVVQTRVAEMFSTKLRGNVEFRKGEVTAWAGYNGHRKSMFSGQVALDLCVARERVLMASMEMQPERTLARMVRQAAATKRPTPRAVGEFSRWTDGRLWLFDHLGRITPEQMLSVIRYFSERLNGTQIFIDSMMMVCKSEESLDEQKQFVTDLVRASKEFQVHIHLICHCRKPQSGDEKRPGKYDLRGSAAISDQADNVITIWANKAKHAKLDTNPDDSSVLNEPDAVVAVEKQRNSAFEGAVKLWFDENSMRFMDDRITRVEPYVMEHE
jgi:twinkle protein